MPPAPVSERALIQQVSQKLANRGIRSPCRVQVQSRNGDVTLSGTVQFAHQKGAALQLVNAISGVRRVIDQLVVKAAVKPS